MGSSRSTLVTSAAIMCVVYPGGVPKLRMPPAVSADPPSKTSMWCGRFANPAIPLRRFAPNYERGSVVQRERIDTRFGQSPLAPVVK
jgi:hypothetical protein